MPASSDEAKRAQIENIYQGSRRSFPNVAEITVDELRDLTARENVVLVDVRGAEEQSVSMIPGAITARHFEEHAKDYQGATIVTYCTVGHRSGLYAKKLHKRGWKVFNLKGAILAWTHGGGELANAQGPTRAVHVHGAQFDLVADGYDPVW